ncbi:MAG: tetratricopeptide repeat protein [Streptosporangiales bacterium]|nr:tetratricopeptide repeat protein [Streptosporangiales bacterium]
MPEDRSPGDDPTPPRGGVYEWYQRGLSLLAAGSPAAALQLFERAADAEPTKHSVREALGRAQYDAGQYAAAAESFAIIVDENPVDDYALFGLGLAATRNGELDRAVEHLTVAVALRPERPHYRKALRVARARKAVS